MKKFYGENITLYGNDIDEAPLKFLQKNGCIPLNRSTKEMLVL